MIAALYGVKCGAETAAVRTYGGVLEHPAPLATVPNAEHAPGLTTPHGKKALGGRQLLSAA